MAESSLYERLGGVFAIAAVIDHFSDAVVRNPITGQQSENPELNDGAARESALSRSRAAGDHRGDAPHRIPQLRRVEDKPYSEPR